MTPPPADPANDLLAEKDQLIAALTEQLELTVNQLDRLQRSGAERSAGGRGGEELSRGNSEVLGRLSGILDQWQAIQPAEHLLRIEVGIDKILEHVEDLATRPAAPMTAPSAGPVAGTAPSRTPQAAPPTGGSFWEATKARLMEGDRPDRTISPSETIQFQVEPQPDELPPSRSSAHVPLQEVDEEQLPPLPEPPGPIGLEADRDTLLRAMDTRDHYIQALVARLRRAETLRYAPVPWHALQAAGEELKSRLLEWECVLQDQLKQAEIANSLERAVLARERGRLIQVKQSVEDQIRQLKPGDSARKRPPGTSTGPGAGPPQTAAEEAEEKAAASDRRWKRLFSK